MKLDDALPAAIALILYFWMTMFFVFWTQSGWYRVDCALGQKRACLLIDDEYAKRARP